MVKTLEKKFQFASMLAVTILLVTLVGLINILYTYSVYKQELRIVDMLCETDGRPEGPPQMRDMQRNDAEGGAGLMEGSVPDAGNSQASTDTNLQQDKEKGNQQQENQQENQQQGDQQGNQQDFSQEDRLNTNNRVGLFQRRMTMDEMLSARFFAVWFDESGQITLTDSSQIYAVTEEGAQEMAQKILSAGKTEGVYQGFRYKLVDKDPIASENQGSKMPEDSAADSTEVNREQALDLQPEAAKFSAVKLLIAMDISKDKEDMLRILMISFLIAFLCWCAMLLPVHVLAKKAIAPTAMSIQRQKQFVTNAGHELKTPLAIIQANTDALELYTGESKWTRNIRTQTFRLNGLMQNLLTLSRMDENSLLLEKKSFAINPLIGEVWEDFQEPAEGRKLSVEMDIEGDPELQVHANRESIAQLLSILFDNAVKYTTPGGVIEIRTAASAEGVHIIQSNTFSGETDGDSLAEDPDRLFDRFYRRDSDRSRKKGGYGIGLSAARAIAGANNGSIHAESSEGIITFTVTLQGPSAEKSGRRRHIV